MYPTLYGQQHINNFVTVKGEVCYSCNYIGRSTKKVEKIRIRHLNAPDIHLRQIKPHIPLTSSQVSTCPVPKLQVVFHNQHVSLLVGLPSGIWPQVTIFLQPNESRWLTTVYHSI